MRLVQLALLVPIGLASSAPATANAQDSPVLVDAAWLDAHQHDRGLVIVHAARAKSDYDAGHVPGARWLEWADYTPTVDGLSVQLPPTSQMRDALESIGVRNDSRIVITGGPIQVSGRLFYTLEYFGFSGRVSLLDGGTAAWKAAGHPLSSRPAGNARAESGDALTLTPVPARVVSAEWVHGNGSASGISLLDARTPEFYTGASAGNQPRAGHIPGAMNVPYSSTLAPDGRFLPKGELRRMFDAAGVRTGNRVVTYCHVGMQASALYVAARIAGFDAAVYDGSFENWSRITAYPVVTGPRP